MKQIALKVLSYTILTAVLVCICSLHACKKEKPVPPAPAEEAALVVALDPNPSGRVTTQGATYDFLVRVTSSLPTQGVTVSVVYKKDSDGSVVFKKEYPTTTASQSVQISGIPFNEVGTAMVVVTSKTKATNTSQKTFQLVRK